MLFRDIAFTRLNLLFDQSPVFTLNSREKIVIFSDLHMGNGGKRDDFVTNHDLFSTVLKQKYLLEGFTLVLNGDIEELEKFTLTEIRSRWRHVYEIFEAFDEKSRFFKILGNHDEHLHYMDGNYLEPGLPALKLLYGDQAIFVFHGHQSDIVAGFFPPLMKHNRTILVKK